MKRRDLLSMAGMGLALAACAPGATLPALPVNVKIPDNLSTLIDDATSAYTKLSSISLPASVSGLLTKLKGAVSSIASSSTVELAKSYVADFSATWAQLKQFVPSTGTAGKIATAVETVLPVMLKVAGLVSMFAAERPTGMSVAQARALLRS